MICADPLADPTLGIRTPFCGAGHAFHAQCAAQARRIGHGEGPGPEPPPFRIRCPVCREPPLPDLSLCIRCLTPCTPDGPLYIQQCDHHVVHRACLDANVDIDHPCPCGERPSAAQSTAPLQSLPPPPRDPTPPPVADRATDVDSSRSGSRRRGHEPTVANPHPDRRVRSRVATPEPARPPPPAVPPAVAPAPLAPSLPAGLADLPQMPAADAVFELLLRLRGEDGLTPLEAMTPAATAVGISPPHPG